MVGMIGECSRIVLGVGLAHLPKPTVLDVDLEETLALVKGIAVRSGADFELAGVPPERCEAWPAWEEIEEEEVDDLPPPIQGDRGGSLSKKTSKVKKRNQISRKRPDPWFDASRPPVFSFTMVTAPENLKGYLNLRKIPYLRLETIPSKWRWRPYSYLTGVPHFPPPSTDDNLWRHRMRFYR